MQNQYLYIIAVVLLAIFLVYHEMQRANKKKLLLRIVAVLVASVALLFFIVPLTYHESQSTDAKAINILTAGVQPSELTQDVYFTTDSGVLKKIGKDRVTFIPDLLYHLASHPEVNGVNVFGFGLAEDVLNNLQDKHVTFRPASTPGGVISCNWPNVLPESDIFHVQGNYNNTSNKPVKLLLEGLGTRLDSVTIPAKRQMTFNLSCQPRQNGRAVYQLLTYNDSEETSRNDIPFQVISRPKIKVLVLAASPDFEYKFLRNWLFDNGYPAFFRTRISKDKFSTEQVNLEDAESLTLSAATLKKYDLVIADDQELGSLGLSNAVLQRAVEAGLGLLIRISETKPLSSFTKALKPTGASDTVTTSIVPVLSGTRKLKAVPVNQPIYIGPNSRALPLVEDTRGKVLASTTLRGNGSITATSVAATYNWVLNGSIVDYAAYWSALINATSRKSGGDFSWRSKPDFPQVGERVDLIFQQHTDTNLPGLTLNERVLSIQQHLVLPFYWQASFRASRPGWNEFSPAAGKKQALYIYDPGAWGDVKANELLQVNAKFQETQVQTQTDVEKTTKDIEKSISRWVFFALFIISVAFLWFETKILQ